MIKLSKVKGEKNFKNREKRELTYKGTPVTIIGFLSRNFSGQENEIVCSNYWKKIIVSQEFYTWQICPSEIKSKDFSEQTEAEGVADLPYKKF